MCTEQAVVCVTIDRLISSRQRDLLSCGTWDSAFSMVSVVLLSSPFCAIVHFPRLLMCVRKATEQEHEYMLLLLPIPPVGRSMNLSAIHLQVKEETLHWVPFVINKNEKKKTKNVKRLLKNVFLLLRLNRLNGTCRRSYESSASSHPS